MTSNLQTSNPLNSGHLTDEQFSDLIAGESAPETALAHLDACEGCRQELAELREAMGAFNELSMEWAEVEAPRRIQTPSRWAVRRRQLPAWGLAAATAAVVVAFGFHQQIMPRPETATAVATSTSAETPSSGDIAEDNQLMMSIDQELNSQVRPSVPVNELRVKVSNHAAVPQVTNE